MPKNRDQIPRPLVAFRTFLLVVATATQATAQSPGPDSAQQDRNKGVESYVGIFGGPASYNHSTVEATAQVLLGPAVTVSQEAGFARSNMGGIRAGGWWSGSDFLHGGLAMELDVAKAKAEQVEVNNNTFSFIPMLRLPLLRNDTTPGGRVNLYGGLGVMISLGGKVTVSFPELPHSVSGTTKGIGFEALAGVALSLGRITLMVEYRHSSIDLKFEDFFDQGRVKLDSTQMLLGASCRF